MSFLAPDIAMLLLLRSGRMPLPQATDTIAGGDRISGLKSQLPATVPKFTAQILRFPGSPRPDPRDVGGANPR
jgi:hypothetical protein